MFVINGGGRKTTYVTRSIIHDEKGQPETVYVDLGNVNPFQGELDITFTVMHNGSSMKLNLKKYVRELAHTYACYDQLDSFLV